MTELIIQTGKHQGKKIDLAGLDCIIGRHEGCKIRIASNDVSKQHCRLRHQEEGIYVKDLGSRNGTFVNDAPLAEETLLKPGDLLRVGPMTFLVSQTKSAPAPAAINSAAKSNPAKEDSADDDLIAAWLSEGGDIEKSGNDTTVVIPSPGAKTAEQKPAPGGKPPSSADTALKSVRDRAQDIIRRWQKQHGKG
jgi:predicted component of type VI protein secretion system